eukprot:jgi/Picsp_1/2198/NSC_05662-R1_---NA---
MIRITSLVPAIVLLCLVCQPALAGYCLCKPGKDNSKCRYPDDYECRSKEWSIINGKPDSGNPKTFKGDVLSSSRNTRILPDDCCNVCREMEKCFFWTWTGSRFGSGCTWYGKKAKETSFECGTCYHAQGKMKQVKE